MVTQAYRVRRAASAPPLDGPWDGLAWSAADTAVIAHFHPSSSPHRPRTEVRVLYDDTGLHVAFRVEDRFVRCVTTTYQGPVYEDACVEFFVRPRTDKGYFNFEMNCGGTLLLRYITDPARCGNELAAFENVPWDSARRIRVHHSLPRTIEPEQAGPVSWTVAYSVPFALFEPYVGPLGAIPGQVWAGNFYKCAENNSHPHFASWSPIGAELNFHQPLYFAPVQFDAA